MPALLGGLFIGVLSALPIINCCCCLWISGGGVLAAYLQQQNQPASLTLPQGARVGLFAGIVGAVVWLLASMALSPVQERLIGVLRTSPDLPPNVQEMLDSAEAGGLGGSLLMFVLMLLCGSTISTIGGMIGAAYFRKDVPPALGGPIHPPPLP
jgi:hypothetical protein